MLTLNKSVSITGMGLISPAGLGIDPLWQACLAKRSLIHEGLGRIPVNSLPTEGGKSFQMGLYALKEAMKDANWNELNRNDVIVIGTTTGQIGLWENDLLKFTQDSIQTQNLSKQPLSTLADDLKKALSFHGRVIILASACSASTQALILGKQLISSGRAKRVLAGGIEELGELTINGFGCLKLLNTSPCKPFDQNRMGINLSEGAGFYALEEKSEKKSYATLLGGDTVLDSYHMTSPEPQGLGLKKAITSALNLSSVEASQIDFIHAHGTGSSHNDLAEASALFQLFSTRPEVISTKGIHGHALGASGALEMGICLKILIEQTIPPVAGLERLDSQIHLNLPLQTVKKKITHLLKTTLGFGGVNSALVLEAANA